VALRERSDAGDPVKVDQAALARANGDRRRGADLETRAAEPRAAEARAAEPRADDELRRADDELRRADDELQRANERLERANAELWRENARLARATLGQSDAAAAAQLLRSERELRPQLGEAEARIDRLERLLATPRHRAVERLRDRLMRITPLYWLFRRIWALAAGSRQR